MTSSSVRDVRGTEMSDEAARETLADSGYGVLSLASDGRAYSVPISFGYDAERSKVYLYLIRFGDDSEKLEFVEDTTEGCLLAFDVRSRFDWESVVVRGALSEIPDEDLEHVEAVMNDNAWFPSLFPPAEPMTGVQWMAMDAAQVTGRRAAEE